VKNQKKVNKINFIKYNYIYIFIETLGDKLKGFAYNFSVYATDKAKEIKDKSKAVINKIQEKYGN
jgi:hypothetical protein